MCGEKGKFEIESVLIYHSNTVPLLHLVENSKIKKISDCLRCCQLGWMQIYASMIQ